MSIQFLCPMCHKQYRLRDELAGKSAKCSCGHKMRVPQASVQPVAVSAPAAAVAAPVRTQPAKAPAESPVLPPLGDDDFPALSGGDNSWLNADLEAAAPVSSVAVRCPACDQLMSGGAVLCTKCGYDKRTGEKRTLTRVEPEKEVKAGRSKLGFAGSLLRGTLFSFIAAMIGAAIWAVLAYFTQYQFGFVAIALGGLSGAGMSLGHDDDDGTLAGIIAAGMSIIGIIAAKVMIVVILICMVVAAVANVAQHPEEMQRSVLAMNMVEGKLKAQGINPDHATGEQFEAAFKAASDEVTKLPNEEVKKRYEAFEKEQRERIQAALNDPKLIDRQRAHLVTLITQQKLNEQGTDIKRATEQQLAAAKQEAVNAVKDLTPEQIQDQLEEFDEDIDLGEGEGKVAEHQEGGGDEKVAADQPAAPMPQLPAGGEQPKFEMPGRVSAIAQFAKMLFNPMDGIFFLLAIGTAYKVGSGKLTD